MVKFFFTFLMCSLVFAEDSSAFVFRTEFSKKIIFSGEQVVASFILESKGELAAEVEVVKFPEFREFWSENLLLRQGRLLFTPTGTRTGTTTAAVGSYSLFPMTGPTTPRIESMRILVRGNGRFSDMLLNSEQEELKILPLPPIPKELAGIEFSGAVGQFDISLDRQEVMFRKNQPFSIRYLVKGEGNFQEINELPLVLPKEVTLLSKTSSIQSGSPFGSKTFEFVLNSESENLPEINFGAFLFFNPQLKRYISLKLPSVKLNLIPEVIVPESVSLFTRVSIPRETYWAPTFYISKNLVFWIAQFIFLLFFTFRIYHNQKILWETSRAQDPLFQRRIKIQKASRALIKHDWSTFLPLAADLARNYVESSKSRSFPSSFPITAFEKLIEADNQLRFSPQKTMGFSPDSLRKSWDEIQPFLAN
jgi:hypothetical protein